MLDISQICKYFYLSSHYNFIFSRDYGINKEINRNHTLNLNVGCKVLNRKGDISIAAYDLLNSHRTFNSQMYSNYIQNTWTNYYGRFFTINFAYRFGKVKSNYEGTTNDRQNVNFIAIQMKDNHTSYIDRENFGRYFTINFSWKFRKIKSNRMDISRGVAW